MKKSKQEFENFKKSFYQLNKLVIALSGFSRSGGDRVHLFYWRIQIFSYLWVQILK